jgi:lysophospholipase L1-like esterase
MKFIFKKTDGLYILYVTPTNYAIQEVFNVELRQQYNIQRIEEALRSVLEQNVNIAQAGSNDLMIEIRKENTTILHPMYVMDALNSNDDPKKYVCNINTIRLQKLVNRFKELNKINNDKIEKPSKG